MLFDVGIITGDRHSDLQGVLMAAKVSIQCPGCLAKLNLADSSKLGKKIKCPKCSDIFVAKANDDEDLDDIEDDDAPAKSKGSNKRAAPAKRGGKKGGSSSSGPNVPLIAGGSVAVIALIGAGLFFSGFFGGAKPLPAPPVEPVPAPVAVAPAPVPAPPAQPAIPPITATEKTLGLRWMPAQTELVVHLKVADLMQAALLKQAFENPMAAMAMAEMKKNTGVAATDIESVTIGLLELPTPQSLTSMGMAAQMGMPGGPKPPQVTAIVRTKRTITLDEILAASTEVAGAEYKTKKYFESKNGETKIGGWLADSSTLIIAPSTELHAIMDRGETVIPRKELAYVDAKPHFLVVAAPKDPKAFAQNANAVPPGTPPEVAAVFEAMKEASGSSLGVSIRGGFDVQLSWMLSSADVAGKLKTSIDTALVEGKKQYEALKSNGLQLVADLGDLLLNNLKVDSASQVVTMTTGVPDSEQQKIELLAQMGIAMASGFGAGGNPFGGPMPGGPAVSPGGPGGAGGPPPFRPSFGTPGQTESVASEKADGLPDGTTLEASASWSAFPSVTPDGKSSTPLQILLDLKGDGIGQVCGYGMVAIKPAVLQGGGTLRTSKTETPGLPNLTKAMSGFDPASLDAIEHPEGTLRIVVSVDPPAAEGKSLEALEGTFKYVTFSDSEEFTIEEASKAAKRPLMDASLKAAGVKLLVSRGPVGEILTLSCGKGFFLGKATGVVPDAPNGLTHSFVPDTDKGQPVQKLNSIDQSGKFPETMQIQFKVFRETKEHTATFKFGKMPLPAFASKPSGASALPGQPQFPGQPMPVPGQPMPIPGQPMPVPAQPMPQPQPKP